MCDMFVNTMALPQDMLRRRRWVTAMYASAVGSCNARQVAFGPRPAGDDVLEHVRGVVVQFRPDPAEGGAVITLQPSEVSAREASACCARVFGSAAQGTDYITPLCV